MKYSLRIASFAGTSIYVHASFVLGVAYLFFQVRPRSLEGGIFTLALIALLFAFVTLHELGHTVVARWHGIAVSRIVLWPLGGAALLSREPSAPRDELLIAVVGPLVRTLAPSVSQW